MKADTVGTQFAVAQGVAVVDKEGKLMGNLSIRDLKLISHDAAMFWRLQQTVKSFLEKVHCCLLLSDTPQRRAVL